MKPKTKIVQGFRVPFNAKLNDTAQFLLGNLARKKFVQFSFEESKENNEAISQLSSLNGSGFGLVKNSNTSCLMYVSEYNKVEL